MNFPFSLDERQQGLAAVRLVGNCRLLNPSQKLQKELNGPLIVSPQLQRHFPVKSALIMTERS
jgi:hypothetical protein